MSKDILQQCCLNAISFPLSQCQKIFDLFRQKYQKFSAQQISISLAMIVKRRQKNKCQLIENQFILASQAAQLLITNKLNNLNQLNQNMRQSLRNVIKQTIVNIQFNIYGSYQLVYDRIYEEQIPTIVKKLLRYKDYLSQQNIIIFQRFIQNYYLGYQLIINLYQTKLLYKQIKNLIKTQKQSQQINNNKNKKQKAINMNPISLQKLILTQDEEQIFKRFRIHYQVKETYEFFKNKNLNNFKKFTKQFIKSTLFNIFGKSVKSIAKEIDRTSNKKIQYEQLLQIKNIKEILGQKQLLCLCINFVELKQIHRSKLLQIGVQINKLNNKIQTEQKRKIKQKQKTDINLINQTINQTIRKPQIHEQVNNIIIHKQLTNKISDKLSKVNESQQNLLKLKNADNKIKQKIKSNNSIDKNNSNKFYEIDVDEVSQANINRDEINKSYINLEKMNTNQISISQELIESMEKNRNVRGCKLQQKGLFKM